MVSDHIEGHSSTGGGLTKHKQATPFLGGHECQWSIMTSCTDHIDTEGHSGTAGPLTKHKQATPLIGGGRGWYFAIQQCGNSDPTTFVTAFVWGADGFCVGCRCSKMYSWLVYCVVSRASPSKKRVSVKAGLWTLDWTMDWTMDWNMDSILDSFTSQGAMFGLGTAQESPQQQLADLQGNLALLL